MIDSNWELCNGAPAHHIERLNAANVINVLEALITLFIANTSENQSLPHMPNERALKEIHRTGTIFLLSNPGEYRQTPVAVVNSQTGDVVHQPPPWEEVQGLMDDFFEQLNNVWVNGDALDAASLALWRINWIHPFKNGNGRTARGFAYACLSARLGVILPGTTTVIDQIMTTRQRYEQALRAADLTFEAGSVDLAPMKNYLNELLQNQINSI